MNHLTPRKVAWYILCLIAGICIFAAAYHWFFDHPVFEPVIEHSELVPVPFGDTIMVQLDSAGHVTYITTQN